MTRRYEIYKDIPLNLIIKKDLKKKKLSQKVLAQILGMSYRSLNKAINGHRYFTKEEGDRIDSFFDYETEFIIRIQGVKKESQKTFLTLDKSTRNSIPQVRACVFWDIDINKLDWIKHSRFIIERVSVYGNNEEKESVNNYYKSLI